MVKIYIYWPFRASRTTAQPICRNLLLSSTGTTFFRNMPLLGLVQCQCPCSVSVCWAGKNTVTGSVGCAVRIGPTRQAVGAVRQNMKSGDGNCARTRTIRSARLAWGQILNLPIHGRGGAGHAPTRMRGRSSLDPPIDQPPIDLPGL